MAQKENTNLRDLSFNLWVRKLKISYMSDYDHFLHYNYENGQERICAFFDLKKGDVIDEHGKINSKSVLTKTSAIKAQIRMADMLDLPFFINITFIDQVNVIMFYVIPMNQKAKKILRLNVKDGESGCWLSEFDYVRFEYFLRFEKFDDPELENKLSKQVVKYKLPKIEL